MLFALLIALVVSCEKQTLAPSDPVKVKGVLVDKQNVPVPNAVMEAVLVQKSKTAVLTDQVLQRDTTDEDGNFEFSSIKEDMNSVDLRIIHPDFKPFQDNMLKTIGTQDRTKVVLQMMYQDTCCGRIQLTIRSAKDSTVISGVEVRLNQGSTLKRKASTNSEGQLTFEEVCGGTYWIRLSKSGFNVKETDGIKVEGCDSSNYVVKTLYMTVAEKDSCCNGVMKINPVDKKTGNLLTGAVVKLRKNGVELTRLNVENTPVVFRELCKGTYSMLIAKDGYTAQEFSVEMGCNDTVEIKKEMEAIQCCNGIMNIKVQDSTGKAIPEATINLFKADKKLGSVYTNSDGKATLKGICEGSYSLSISRTNYKSIEFTQTMGCDDTVNIEKTLYYSGADTCCKGIIKVAVKDASTNDNLNGATVQVYLDGKLLRTEKVAEGIASIKELCQGNYKVLISKDGYKATDFSVEMGCNQTKEFTKSLYRSESDSCCNGVAKIKVKNYNGERLVNALVKLWKGGTLLSEYKTNNDGYVLFTKLCPGTYGVSMSTEGYKGQEFNFTITCNDTLSFEKTLARTESDSCCNGVVKVIIKDSQGNRLTPASLKLWKGGSLLGTYTANGDGYVLLTKLCPGTYGVNLSKDGYKGMEFSFTITCNDTLTYEKTLSSEDSCCNGVVKVIVKNNNGTRLTPATVRLWKGGTKLSSYTTNNDGVVIFTKLCEGNYAIDVSKDGYTGVEFSFTMTCDDTLTYEKTLTANQQDTCCNGVVKFIFRTEGGEALANTGVKMTRNGSVVRSGNAGSDGTITFRELCNGTYAIRVARDGYKVQEFNLTLDCNDTVEVERTLVRDTCCTGVLQLHVIDDSTGTAINEARIEVRRDGSMFTDGYTNNEGNFGRENICAPSTYSVRISKDGYTTREFTFTYTGCTSKSETIRLRRN